MPGSSVNHLLNPGDEGSEGGYQDPSRCLPNSPVQCITYHLFRRGETGQFGISGVREEQEHSPGAIGGKLHQIGGLTVHGGIVYFEVTGVNDQPDGGVYGQTHCIGYTVTHREKFHSEFAKPY